VDASIIIYNKIQRVAEQSIQSVTITESHMTDTNVCSNYYCCRYHHC